MAYIWTTASQSSPPETSENAGYLKTKQLKLGHLLAS